MDLLGTSGAPADPSLSARRRKIALLVLLASARRPVSKDSLLEMFWGEQDETRARHSLSDALSHIRRVLGRGSVVANQATAALDPSTALAVDSVEFAAAVKDGNDALALELYAGPFLDGVHVDGSTSFEQWVSAERHRLSSLFGRACGRRASALLAASEWEECVDVTRRWLECEPASSAAAKIRLQAIAGPGTREAAVRAVQEFERITHRLNSELGLRPDASVAEVARDLANRIRQDELPAGHTSEFAVPEQGIRSRAVPTASEIPTSAERPNTPPSTSFIGQDRRVPTPHADVPIVFKAEAIAKAFADKPSESSETVAHKKSRWMIPVAVAALLVAAVSAAFYVKRDSATPVTNQRTVVAITDFGFVNGDSAQGWMADGVATMLASRLSRSTALELIAPERIREIARRAEYPTNQPLGTERSRDVGVRAGANWVVSGAMSKADTTYLLELTVRDVKSGKVLRVSSVRAREFLPLADAAAAQLLDVVDPASSGAKLADLETSSQDAYLHFVAYVRYSNGVSNKLAREELNKALALDSNFISAIIERRRMASGENDAATLARLNALYKKNEGRATFWDRTTLEAERIQPLGEVGRILALYRELVARYPRDPRAYTRLWNALTMNGEWKEAERIALAQLAIDSLAATAGNGVCAPCGAYSDLAFTRLALGDGEGAEKAVRRLLELQPDLGGGWSVFSTVLLARGKYDEGLEAYRRAHAINPEDTLWWFNLQARNLILANKLHDADTLINRLTHSDDPFMRDNMLDIRALWFREQGNWAEALKFINQEDKEGGDKRQIRLMRANTLARMGKYAEARREFESMHELYKNDPRGDYARWFSWTHTLEGDALAPTGDTILLKVLADSALLIGSASYYARDKTVPHFLRALVAVQGGRDDEAEREFKIALFSRNGFTRVNYEYARLMMRKKRYKEAEELLSQALMGPLDAMLRYQPRSEVRVLIDSVRALSAKR
ncbi:MAG: BTAD domain-containing putative transcriptional regulator [Gemmatimonadaceae bacterium]